MSADADPPAAAQAEEARFRELADAMPQIVWSARPDGYVDQYNDRWYQFTGLPRQGGGDESWKPILHPDDVQRCVEHWYRAVRSGEAFEMEYRYREARTGIYRWHLGRALPVRDAQGRILRWYGTATDIHAQRQAEAQARASEESLSLAIEATGIGTWDYHPATDDLLWSASCRAIWGLGADRAVRFADWIAAIHPDDRAMVSDAVGRALRGEDGGRYAVEFRMRRFDNGDERWLAAGGRVSFAADGSAQRFIGTTSDITARRLDEIRRRFLDDTRRALAPALAAQQQLLAVARAAVPAVADWCVIDLVVEGTRRELCRIHADPLRVAQAQEIRSRFPSRRGDALIASVQGGSTALIDDLDGFLAGQAPDASYVQAIAALGLRSALVVPIHVRGRLHALLTLATAESGRRYDGDDQRFGDELGRSLSMALEHNLLYRETAEARREAETLNAVGASVASELDLETVVQVITDAGTAATGAQFGAFFYNVVDQQGARYTLYTISGVPREAFAKFPMPRATALFGPTFRGEGVLRMDDVRLDPRFGQSAPYHGLPPGHLPVVSYLAVPVRSRSGEVLGGLFFGHPEAARFGAHHERLVLGIAAQAAIAIDNANLFRDEKAAREAAARRADDLARSNAELEQFAYVSSHDLQEPLRTITQYLELLEMRYLGRLDERARRYVGYARDSATRMYQLINDLLGYSRAGRDAARLDEVDLAALVDEILADLSPSVARTRATIATLGLGTIRCDRTLTRQVLQNLIANALKFTAEGQAPAVTVSCREADGAWVLSVADRGIGIDPQFHERIFQVFQRLHRQEQYAGSGIGLAICQKLAHRQGGSIRVDSRPGEGAVFSLTIPMHQPAVPA